MTRCTNNLAHLRRPGEASLVGHVLDDFLDIAHGFLGSALGLFVQAFGLLGGAADHFACLLLHLAGRVFGSALDLVLVHGDSFRESVSE